MAVCRRVARDVHPRAVNDARLLRGVVVRAKCIWWSAMYCGSSSAHCSGGSCSYCRVDSVGADHHLHVVTGVDGTTACARRSRRPTHATTSSSCGLRRTRCSSNPHCHVRQQYAYVIFNHPVKTHNLPRSLTTQTICQAPLAYDSFVPSATNGGDKDVKGDGGHDKGPCTRCGKKGHNKIKCFKPKTECHLCGVPTI